MAKLTLVLVVHSKAALSVPLLFQWQWVLFISFLDDSVGENSGGEKLKLKAFAVSDFPVSTDILYCYISYACIQRCRRWRSVGVLAMSLLIHLQFYISWLEDDKCIPYSTFKEYFSHTRQLSMWEIQASVTPQGRDLYRKLNTHVPMYVCALMYVCVLNKHTHNQTQTHTHTAPNSISIQQLLTTFLLSNFLNVLPNLPCGTQSRLASSHSACTITLQTHKAVSGCLSSP